MNIIIPLGGKGERFSKEGYVHPKPLIPIFEKNMIDYVLNNLTISINDKVFIIYNNNLDNHNFSTIIREKYPYIHLININDTKGAVETLFIGIQFIITNYEYNDKCILLDCDTFYTEDIIGIFRNSIDNMVFYTKNYDNKPIYSYIKLNNESTIINIKEKNKISDNANTGAYAFTDIKILHEYCKYVLDNNITFNNEPYTSCVISEMIKANYIFKGYELNSNYVFSLGTPNAVQTYIDNTFAFLFDLDGTLVITDDIYYDVWKQILINYNITLSKEIFEQFIQGNNDKYVINSLLKNIDISLTELSELKDSLFIDNIHKLKIIDGVYDIINQIKLAGYKICIVTNCNKNVAKKIVDVISIENKIDFIISSDDCLHGKPNSEPYKKAIKKYNIDNQKCFVFEDSKSGLLSGKGVDPNLLIGIETIYDNNELLKYGVDISIKNYLHVNINDLINNEDKHKQFLLNMIKNNTTIRDVAQIDLNNQYLKGGFIADVLGFKIITNDNTVYSQILKYENDQENDLSLMAKKLCLYEREYYFYTDISSKININIPIFFNLIKNDKFNNCGIVLENLIEKKYKINLNLNVESIDVTLKIIDRMADMHSFFWNKNLKQMFPKLKGSTDEIFSPFLSDFINERREKFTNKWYPVLNKFQISKCDEIFNNFDNIQKRFSMGDNLTFIHGDIKSPNIFYDVENNYEPYFIDWQHCAIGKGVQDLIFFIIESFNINNINSIFYLTKYYYYMKLQEFGITNYSFEEYENDIYDAICYIPFFTGVWFGTVPHDELIDKNFPYFLISKMFYLIEIISK
uniref:CHK kinase-like domain-containing protein n=1 Tax=viral metagenome TaxID=1070528 RepID=A0A6C0DLF6_9ZZZZ